MKDRKRRRKRRRRKRRKRKQKVIGDDERKGTDEIIRTKKQDNQLLTFKILNDLIVKSANLTVSTNVTSIPP